MIEAQIGAMLVLLAFACFCLLVAKVIDVMDPRSPEQKRKDELRDELLSKKRQWCVDLGGPCHRIRDRKIPFRYCYRKCEYHAMCSRRYRRRVSFEEVYGDPYNQK